MSSNEVFKRRVGSCKDLTYSQSLCCQDVNKPLDWVGSNCNPCNCEVGRENYHNNVDRELFQNSLPFSSLFFSVTDSSLNGLCDAVLAVLNFLPSWRLGLCCTSWCHSGDGRQWLASKKSDTYILGSMPGGSFSDCKFLDHVPILYLCSHDSLDLDIQPQLTGGNGNQAEQQGSSCFRLHTSRECVFFVSSLIACDLSRSWQYTHIRPCPRHYGSSLGHRRVVASSTPLSRECVCVCYSNAEKLAGAHHTSAA